MQNIIAGFRITGVYPFDRSVLLTKESKRVSLADKTGLKFIPPYSPAHRQPSKSSARVSHFSPEEIARYQACFEEGYDVPDEHYQQWVRMYHPKSLCKNVGVCVDILLNYACQD